MYPKYQSTPTMTPQTPVSDAMNISTKPTPDTSIDTPLFAENVETTTDSTVPTPTKPASTMVKKNKKEGTIMKSMLIYTSSTTPRKTIRRREH